MLVYAQQNDTVDLLCWRYLGQTAEVVEQVLNLNPGLAALGAILPQGEAVILPDAAPATTQQSQPVQLWD